MKATGPVFGEETVGSIKHEIIMPYLPSNLVLPALARLMLAQIWLSEVITGQAIIA